MKRLPLKRGFLPDLDYPAPAAAASLGLATGSTDFAGLHRGLMSTRGHTHANLEVNFIETGGISYLLNGRLQSLRAGETGVFWAAYPHRICEALPGTLMHWATVPVEDFLSWDFSSGFYQQLFSGSLLVDARSHPARDRALFLPGDALHAALRRRVMLLEMQARLLRLQAHLRDTPGTGLAHGSARFLSPGAIAMATHIATHFRESLRLGDIARAAGLHPSYAARLFRRVFGMTTGHFLAQSRVAHALALLRTTDAGILDIALASGFPSSSRFYDTFRRLTGRTPKTFRSSVTPSPPRLRHLNRA